MNVRAVASFFARGGAAGAGSDKISMSPVLSCLLREVVEGWFFDQQFPIPSSIPRRRYLHLRVGHVDHVPA